jgi:glutamate:GABA antiporter
LLQNAAGIFYALTYLVMFALPILGLRGVARRPPLWLLAASASGFLMTLLYVVLSVFPIIQVESRLWFATKIASVIVLANIMGASIFLLAARRRRRGEAEDAPAYAD